MISMKGIFPEGELKGLVLLVLWYVHPYREQIVGCIGVVVHAVCLPEKCTALRA